MNSITWYDKIQNDLQSIMKTLSKRELELLGKKIIENIKN